MFVTGGAPSHDRPVFLIAPINEQEDGDVVCFGRNGECQLGRSENVEYCAQPLKQSCINLGDDADGATPVVTPSMLLVARCPK